MFLTIGAVNKNIKKLYKTLPKIFFTVSETKCNYY